MRDPSITTETNMSVFSDQGAFMLACAEPAWQEVMDSNMSKVDPETKKVIKREDGKVLKPASFKRPNLVPYVYD